MHNRRRPLFAPELYARVALAWVMISGLMLVTSYGAIAAMRFPDPDDVMRLMQVRDLLNGQSWFDVHQYRVDAAGGGVPMHWSRLVDVPCGFSRYSWRKLRLKLSQGSLCQW
jgi:hypothetical protein